MSAWQPIKTAPYEIDVLIYSANYNPTLHIAWWDLGEDGEKQWHLSDDTGRCDGTRADDLIEDIEPTHWLYIPDSPQV